jgi:predicted DNA-binding transcriptional regulator AlpA
MSQPETLIAQPRLRQILGGISDMTIWRWRKDGLLPAPIVIRRRNYWRSDDIAAVQKRLATESEAEHAADDAA